ncbi:MAG TPA: IPT/TIG domain-containing protein [Bryobacteraceae bacterium]|nr:IPT/TIG domain-containing protein [Bryobacteraceae bacterium]
MRRLALIAALAVCALPAPAYYHFIHYVNGASVPEKFDLTALPSKTVTIFVSENGPQIYSQTDTFNSVLTQIWQATQVWNGISASDLRVSFGGLENSATLQNTPGGDIVFEDLPPGVYGYGGPTSKAVPITAADGSLFVPIIRSTVHLNRNLTVLPGPSFDETFFMTTVHELGHALGLQHTFTSSTMSQATTRATTLSHPIDNDDIAGISTLYPTAKYAQFGSISGRITAGGQGVHMASVVAIRAGEGAVSAVTNPDGTYRIDGIPPGPHFVYVHTMPPDADIYGPWNADGSVAAPSGPIGSLFYPNTTSLTGATAVSVQSGVVTGGIDIAASPRSAVTLYDDVVYSYLGNTPVQPAFIDLLNQTTTVALSGFGLGTNGQSPGLGVQIIGGSVAIPSNGIRPNLANGYTYVALDLAVNPFSQAGPQHVVVTTPEETYLLPSGINLTQLPPPTVIAAAGSPDGTVSIAGTNWAADTRLYFDGLPSAILAIDPKGGSAVVQPPPGAAGQQATVTAYNSDGQNSQQFQTTPVTYSYGNAAAPVIASIAPASLPAGAEASIDITGSGFNFTPGLTTVGFGTSDIAVRRIFVLAPNHLQVDVSVSSNAALSNPDVSVISGFQLATAPAGFQITAAVPGLPDPIPVLENGVQGLTNAYPGAIVSIFGSNLSAANAPVVTIGGQAVGVLYASPTQLNLQLPATLVPGAALLTLNNGAASAFPVTVNIDTPPAGIDAIQDAAGAYITATHPARQGSQIIVTLSGFAAPGANIDLSRVQVSVGGVAHSVIQITPAAAFYQLALILNQSDPIGPAERVIVYLDGRSSLPASIAVAQQNQ